MYSKIQVIKILRDQIDGLSLSDAKTIVDSYELKNFEDRVVRTLGEEARNELRNWARLFVSRENRIGNSFVYNYGTQEADHSDDSNNWCNCEDCQVAEF